MRECMHVAAHRRLDLALLRQPLHVALEPPHALALALARLAHLVRGAAASDTWVAASGAWAAAFGTLGLQSLIHAVAALRAHLVLLAPPPRLRRRAPRLHQLGRRRALLLRCRRAHHRCPQLGG